MKCVGFAMKVIAIVPHLCIGMRDTFFKFLSPLFPAFVYLSLTLAASMASLLQSCCLDHFHQPSSS
jgi:hypothetical protein